MDGVSAHLAAQDFLCLGQNMELDVGLKMFFFLKKGSDVNSFGH